MILPGNGRYMNLSDDFACPGMAGTRLIPCPKNMEDVVIMRVVVRQGTGKDLADLLVKDIKTNIAQLNQLQEPTNSAICGIRENHKSPEDLITPDNLF